MGDYLKQPKEEYLVIMKSTKASFIKLSVDTTLNNFVKQFHLERPSDNGTQSARKQGQKLDVLSTVIIYQYKDHHQRSEFQLLGTIKKHRTISNRQHYASYDDKKSEKQSCYRPCFLMCTTLTWQVKLVYPNKQSIRAIDLIINLLVIYDKSQHTNYQHTNILTYWFTSEAETVQG